VGLARSSDWSEEDTRWQLASTFFQVIDAGQTADIHNHEDIHEAHPITSRVLGKNPDETETALYFTGLIGLNYMVARTLPKSYRRGWQLLTITIGVGLVTHNHQLGLRWGF